jgi:8-oxo-dGTP diphosphatase
VHHTVVSSALLLYLLAPMVVVWVYHLAQRRYAEAGEKKRTASLLFALVFVGLWVASYALRQFNADDVFLIPVFFLAFTVISWRRKDFFPFRFSCAQCGKPLSLQKILFYDSNACDACDPPARKSMQGGGMP